MQTQVSQQFKYFIYIKAASTNCCFKREGKTFPIITSVTYLGCSPSFQFWHLRIWGLRYKTNNRESFLLCLLGVTARKEQHCSFSLRVPWISLSVLISTESYLHNILIILIYIASFIWRKKNLKEFKQHCADISFILIPLLINTAFSTTFPYYSQT